MRGIVNRCVDACANRFALLTALTLLVGCDHATKFAAKAELEGQAPRSLIQGVLGLRYTENTDVAFNLLCSIPERVRAPLLTIMGAAAIVALLGFLLHRRRGLGFARIAILLMTAGALGNVLDRVVRGYVVDFVQVPHWPIFNVADIYVTAGAILLTWTAIGGRPQSGERSPSS
jgi:signal peptidase II